MQAIRTLVTGAGSGVGQGIIKALRVSDLPVCIVAADITPMNSALFRADEGLLLPKVEDAGALERIIDSIRRACIDAVLIGSEFDLEFFSVHRDVIEQETGALVIVSPPDVVEVGNDKRRTVEFLRDHGLPYAPCEVPVTLEDAIAVARSIGYPVIVKDRKGTSSRHVYVVHDEGELCAVFAHVPRVMIQKLISLPDAELSNEYTCSVFKAADGSLFGPFTARRSLRGGSSWVIEVRPFPVLHDLLLAIGQALPIMGTFNVQLMIGQEGPVPFEFNARSSGTTAVRAHFGFNEPDMALRSYLLGESLAQPTIRSGLAFRYLEEIFVDGAFAEDSAQYFTQGIVRPWF